MVEHKLFNDYDDFYQIVIDRDYATSKKQEDVDEIIAKVLADKGLPATTKVSFDISTKLWNLSKLQEEIEARANIEELQKIVQHLKEHYGPITELVTFKDTLIPYKVAFERQLDPATKTSSYQFHNDFFGRAEVINSLEEFAANPTEKLLIITAPGGSGKTRACIEFFNKNVDGDDSKIAFVLNELNFDMDKFRQGVNTDRQVFILLDDADSMQPIIKHVVNLAYQHENVKLIFTVRDLFYVDVLNVIPSHNKKHIRIILEKLSYTESKSMLATLLPGLIEANQAILATKADGVPIVILSLVDLISNGRPIDQLISLDAFEEHVRMVRGQAIEHCHQSTFLPKEKVANVISAISFFGPVANNDEELALVAEFTKIPMAEVAAILSNLKSEGLIGRGEFHYAIKPDPYSDIILAKNAASIKYWLNTTNMGVFRNRIMRNIMALSESHPSAVDINKLVNDFTSHLKELAIQKKYRELLDGLETIAGFAYKKPSLAIQAVEGIVPILPIDKEVHDIDFWSDNKKVSDVYKALAKVINIASINSVGEAQLNQILQIAMQLYKASGDSGHLKQPFLYREYDFEEYGYRPSRPFERQLFLLEKLKKMLSSNLQEKESSDIIIALAKALLITEFSLEEFFEYQTGRFSYGMGYVPKNEKIIAIRDTIYNLLLENFEKFEVENKEKILELLMRKVTFLRKEVSRRNQHFDESEELKKILPFIIEQIGTGKYDQLRTRLIRNFQIELSFGTKEIFDEEVELLNDLLFSSSEPKERLATFLKFESREFERTLDSTLQELLSNSANAIDFFQLIEAVRHQGDHQELQQLQQLFKRLVEFDPDFAIKLLEHVVAVAPKDAAIYSVLAKANYTDKEKFQKIVDFFWNLGDEASQVAVIQLLTYGRNHDKSLYTDADIDYFESIIDMQLPTPIFHLTYILPDYLPVNPERILGLTNRILGPEIGHNDHGMLVRRLFEKEHVSAINPELMKKFLLDSTDTQPIDHEHDNAIIYLEEKFGFDATLEFLQQKFEAAATRPYHHATSYGYSYPGDRTEESRIERFISVLKLFLDDGYSINPELLQLFSPYSGFSTGLERKLEDILPKIIGDSEKLLKLLQMLTVIDRVNETYLAFILRMGKILEEHHGRSEEELRTIFPPEFLNTASSKSKPVAALYYYEDIQLKEIINNTLAVTEASPKIKAILSQVSEKIEHSMQLSSAEAKKRMES